MKQEKVILKKNMNMQPIKETSFKTFLNGIFREMYLAKNKVIKFSHSVTFSVSAESVETIKIQFQILDLITLYTTEIQKNNTPTDCKFISLTEKGKERVLALRAVRKTP